ncbi:MAG: CheR family methyltransferase [Vicinamibacterales bacterium]
MNAALRSSTSFRLADATQTVPAGPWDLVLCRNLVIYLQADAGERLFAALAASLAPGSFFVVGKAERLHARLALSPVSRCVYRSHAR